MKNILTVLLLVLLAGCGANKAAVPYHQDLQKEATFDNRLGNVDSFTKNSYKADLKALEKELRELQKRNQSKSDMREMESRMTDLRKQIEELKKQ